MNRFVPPLVLFLFFAAGCSSTTQQIPEHQNVTIVMHLSPELADDAAALKFFDQVVGNLSVADNLQVINGDNDQAAVPKYAPISVKVVKAQGAAANQGRRGQGGGAMAPASSALGDRANDARGSHNYRLQVLSTLDPGERIELQSLQELRHYLRLQ